MRKILFAGVSALLVGCGGGERDNSVFDIFSSLYDEVAQPVESFTPPANQFSFFPLALHFRATERSYVSKVGTSSTRTYSISGTMTTPAVVSGAYSGTFATTVRYLGSTLFEGASVIPVVSDSRTFNITLNGAAQPEVNTSSTSYFDTTMGIRVGGKGTSTYKVLDPIASTALPEIVFSGEGGDFLVYRVWSDSSKSNLIGRDVLAYKVLTTSIGTAGEYKATVQSIVRSYSVQGQLIGVQTSTDDLVYDQKTGAKSRNISFLVEDIAGATTSRLFFTRVL